MGTRHKFHRTKEDREMCWNLSKYTGGNEVDGWWNSPPTTRPRRKKRHQALHWIRRCRDLVEARACIQQEEIGEAGYHWASSGGVFAASGALGSRSCGLRVHWRWFGAGRDLACYKAIGTSLAFIYQRCILRTLAAFWSSLALTGTVSLGHSPKCQSQKTREYKTRL